MISIIQINKNIDGVIMIEICMDESCAIVGMDGYDVIINKDISNKNVGVLEFVNKYSIVSYIECICTALYILR